MAFEGLHSQEAIKNMVHNDDWLNVLRLILLRSNENESQCQLAYDIFTEATKVQAVGSLAVCLAYNRLEAHTFEDWSKLMNNEDLAKGWGRELRVWRERIKTGTVDAELPFIEKKVEATGKNKAALHKSKAPPVLSSSLQKGMKSKSENSATAAWGSKELIEKSMSSSSSPSSQDTSLSPKGPGFT
jgi:hypothetical protein